MKSKHVKSKTKSYIVHFRDYVGDNLTYRHLCGDNDWNVDEESCCKDKWRYVTCKECHATFDKEAEKADRCL